LGIYILFLDF